MQEIQGSSSVFILRAKLCWVYILQLSWLHWGLYTMQIRALFGCVLKVNLRFLLKVME